MSLVHLCAAIVRRATSTASPADRLVPLARLERLLQRMVQSRAVTVRAASSTHSPPYRIARTVPPPRIRVSPEEQAASHVCRAAMPLLPASLPASAVPPVASETPQDYLCVPTARWAPISRILPASAALCASPALLPKPLACPLAIPVLPASFPTPTAPSAVKTAPSAPTSGRAVRQFVTYARPVALPVRLVSSTVCPATSEPSPTQLVRSLARVAPPAHLLASKPQPTALSAPSPTTLLRRRALCAHSAPPELHPTTRLV